MTGVICLTLHLTRVGFQNLPFPSVSAMSSAKLDVLEYRIPARMRELESFVRLGVALESNPPNSDITVKIGDSSYSTTDHRFLLHPLADAAAIISRGLLNFLGLSSQNGSLIAKPLTRKDNLKMSDIGLGFCTQSNFWLAIPTRGCGSQTDVVPSLRRQSFRAPNASECRVK